MNDEADEETALMKKQYKILDSGVFNHLIVGSLKNMGEILDALINRDKSTETEYVLIVYGTLELCRSDFEIFLVPRNSILRNIRVGEN